MMNQYETIKKKKNKFIFVISFSFLLTLSVALFLIFQPFFNKDIGYSIFLVLLLGYVFFLIYFRSNVVEVMMKYDYFRMLDEDLGLIQTGATLYTKNWLKDLEENFEKHYEDSEIIFYYKFHKKLPKLGRTGRVLVYVIVSKEEDYDFHSNTINKHVEEVYNNYPHEKRVRKQIGIHFKKYQSFNEKHKEELQEIINFKNGDILLMNIPVGYFVKEHKLYFLRPLKRFPHKYYYYTTNLIKELSYIDGEEK